MARIFTAFILAAAIAAPAGAFAQTAQDTRSGTVGGVGVSAVVAKPNATSGITDEGPNALLNRLRDARPVMPSMSPSSPGDAQHG